MLYGTVGEPGEADPGAGPREVLVDVGVRAPAGQLADLGAAEAGQQEGEVRALALQEAGENRQRLTSLKACVVAVGEA